MKLLVPIWQSIHTSWLLVWRFITRMFLDDEGAPSIWPFLAVYVTLWLTRIVARTEDELAFEQLWISAAFCSLIVIIAAATRLGAGIIVPIADSFMQALGKAVGFGASAADSIKARLAGSKSVQYESPDRTMPVSEAELARPAEMPWDPESGEEKDPARPPMGSKDVHPFDADERG